MKRYVLVILDGFGIGKNTSENAIYKAHTPCVDNLLKTYPHTELQASEEFVGLPKGQMGNSEVGHLTIGAGRIVRQGLVEIDHAIETGEFEKHSLVQELIAKSKNKRCHLLGLFSEGGVHSHQHHFIKMAEILAQKGMHVYLHLFTDGRDTPPQSALDFIQAIPQHPLIHIATVQGRYFAMDRDNRWERTEKAYRALVQADGIRVSSAAQAIEQSYLDGKTDEFIEPYVIGHYKGMEGGDSLIHINFRADRVRQLLSSLVLPEFDHFQRNHPIQFMTVLGMSEYSDTLNAYSQALYPQKAISDGLIQTLCNQGKKVLKLAETEKYAHVTFFLNGGIEPPCPGEDRILIPSPKVATYDLAPEMSAKELTDQVVSAIEEEHHDFIVVNYANPDMVGHTAVQPAIIKAIECIDVCLGRIYKAAVDHHTGIFITADHGNVEQMVEQGTDAPHTAHTCNPVPFIAINTSIQKLRTGTLADIAPTLLTLYQIPSPLTMSGQCLIV